MMMPGAIALISPLIIGFVFGPEVLGGFLAGATVSGVLMGMFQNNAGGAWDNAKKSFEKGAVINGETYYKGSEPHKASVTGDTVGDPFKDTSGPSMNILIKLMSIVSLVIAPTLAKIHHDQIINNRNDRMHNLVLMNGDTAYATTTPAVISTNKNVFSDNDINNLEDKLFQDGVLTTDSYTLAAKNNKLYINGVKQSDAINNRYKDYYFNKGDFQVKETHK